MIPYLSLVFVSSISTVFDKSKFENIVLGFLCFFMLLILTLRGNSTGPADYDGYLNMYTKVNSWIDVIEPTVHAEIGFRFLSFVGNTLNFEPQFIIASMGILSFLPILYVVKRYSPYTNLSLYIWLPYFLTMNMHSSRTSVAAAFGLLFILYFVKNQRLKSLIFFLLALSFHSSSIILILILLIRLNIKKLIFLLILSLFFALFINIWEIISFFLNLVDLHKYSIVLNNYIESSDYGHPMKIYDPRIVLSVIIVTLLYRFKNKLTDNEMIFYKTFILGLFVMIIFSSSTIFAWRVSYFFLIVSIIIVPITCKYYNISIFRGSNVKKIMSTIFLFVYALYVFGIIYNAEPYLIYKGII